MSIARFVIRGPTAVDAEFLDTRIVIQQFFWSGWYHYIPSFIACSASSIMSSSKIGFAFFLPLQFDTTCAFGNSAVFLHSMHFPRAIGPFGRGNIQVCMCDIFSSTTQAVSGVANLARRGEFHVCALGLATPRTASAVYFLEQFLECPALVLSISLLHSKNISSPLIVIGRFPLDPLNFV